MYRGRKNNNRFADRMAEAFGGDFYNRRKREDGEEVIVLISATYNDPKHRSLGQKEPGDIIRVAVGPYLQYLLENGYVRRVSDAKPTEPADGTDDASGESETTTAPISPEPPDTSNQTLADLVSERMLKVLYEAGFFTREDILASYERNGLVELVALRGIGENKAKEIVKWAGVTE